MNTIKKIFFYVALFLCIIGLILKYIIDSTKIAVAYTTMPIACLFLIAALFLLIIHNFINNNASKYIFLFAMLFLIVEECLCIGNTISIIFYIILAISTFKPVKKKTINITTIAASLTTIVLTIYFIIDSINYNGNFYYAAPTIICLISSLCANTGVWVMAFESTSK